eukprot:COSAG05_NODE_1513_length_4667_cov_51.337785_6_plen_249_part_00
MDPTTKAYYAEQLKEARPLNLELLEFISEQELEDRISFLQDYESRNSFSGDNGLNQAVTYAEAEFLGYGFETTRMPFREDMTPQLIATLRGSEEPDVVVVVGAHFDSRGTQSTSPTQRAPGADDNGSGSASVLEFARVIHESGATFRHTLKLCLFTGEEQGLIGSRALASQMAEEGVNVIAMFNAVRCSAYPAARVPTPFAIAVVGRGRHQPVRPTRRHPPARAVCTIALALAPPSPPTPLFLTFRTH